MKAYRNSVIITILIVLSIFSQNFILASETKINMNFKGADIRDVFRTIAELAEVNLVTDSSVSGNITIHLKDLSFIDALNLITQAHDLAYKWYDNTVVVATPEKIDQIYGEIEVKTVDVKHAEVSEVQNILSSVFPTISIVSDQRNQKLIFKGKIEDINGAEGLLAKLDTEKEKVTDIITIPLEKSEFLKNYLQKVYPDLVIESDEQGNFVIYGSPYDIGNANMLLSRLIEQLNSSDNNKGPYDLLKSVKINYIDVSYVKELVSEMYPDINVIADSKNSQLIFNGSNQQLSQLKGLVSIIDKELYQIEDFYITQSIQVNHANIDNVITALEEISNSLSVERLGNNKIILTGTEKDVERALALADSIDRQEEKLTKVVSIDYASIEDLEGIIKDIYPDISYLTNPQNKEVILSGKKDMVEDAIVLIKEIDIPRKQVIIEVRVEEISITDIMNLGVNPDDLSKIVFLDNDNDNFIDSVGLTFAEVITLLESNAKTNTLANPRLMTLSGEEASLLIGNRIPVTVEHVEDGRVVVSVEFIEAGINLIFTPWITSDNKINLKVNPQVSSIGDPIGTAIPPINTREAETNIRLNDGETFAIGGLIQDDIIESISKVPLLGDIPIFGELFKSRNTQNMKTELIIFITPHIVNDSIEVDNKEDSIAISQNNIIEEGEENIQNAAETMKKSTKKDIVKTDNSDDKPGVEVEKVLNPTDNENLGENIDTEKIGTSNYSNSLQEDDNKKDFIRLTPDEIKAILGQKKEEKEDLVLSEEKADIRENNIDKNIKKEKEEESNGEEKNETMFSEKGNFKLKYDIDKKDKFKDNASIETEKELENKIDFSNYFLYDYLLDSEISMKELAELFKVEEELIVKANKNSEFAVGSYIKVPFETSRIHIVEKGETLWKIHSLYGVSVDDIKILNKISDESNISVGTVIVIPQ